MANSTIQTAREFRGHLTHFASELSMVSPEIHIVSPFILADFQSPNIIIRKWLIDASLTHLAQFVYTLTACSCQTSEYIVLKIAQPLEVDIKAFT